MPEMTGEIASGRSMSVTRKLLPGNSNFAIHQAAASPNIVLSGTTTAAVINVSRIDARVSGSENERQYAASPCSKAAANTIASGASSSAARKARQAAMSPQRTSAVTIVSRPGRVANSSRNASGMSPAISVLPPSVCRLASVRRPPSARRGDEPPPSPGVDEIDREQHHERHDEHHGPERRGAPVVELLQVDDDEKRRDLGLPRNVARDEDDRAVLAHRARERECKPGQHGRQHGRQDDAPEHVEAAGAQRLGGFLQ